MLKSFSWLWVPRIWCRAVVWVEWGGRVPSELGCGAGQQQEAWQPLGKLSLCPAVEASTHTHTRAPHKLSPGSPQPFSYSQQSKEIKPVNPKGNQP